MTAEKRKTSLWVGLESRAFCRGESEDLAAEAITELEAVVDDLREIVALVQKEEGVGK